MAMMFIIDIIPALCAVLLGCGITVVLYVFYLEIFARLIVPKNLPLAGFGNETFFSWSRASWRQILAAPDTAELGYRQYGEKQRSYVIPHSSFRAQVMLPQKDVKWLTRQPETVLNAEVVRLDRQGINFFPLSTDSKTILLAAHKIIGEALNQRLDSVQPNMYEGIRKAVDAGLGTDTETWRELPLMDTLETVLDSSVSSVMFVPSLSQNPKFLRLLRLFILGGGVLTELVGQLPVGLFRPVVGIPFHIFTMAVKKRCSAYLRPAIEARISKIEAGQEEDSFDFISRCIRTVRKLKFPINTDETTFICDMLLFLALAGVVSTRTTTVNSFMDILGPGAETNTYETLRREAESIFQSEDDWTSASSLKDMVNIDSAVRESARKNPLQTRGLMKQVMPKDGITLPDGQHVPQGTWLGIPVEAIHRDESIYSDAREYDALRFARIRAGGKSLESSHPSDTYMFFSYGRSACPGRWFATRMMKLILAYVTLHYDMKPLPENSERFSVGDTKFHHSTVKMVFRRRKLD